MTFLSIIQKNLETQGYKCDLPMFEKIEPWLRFNPALCLTIAVIGMIFGSSKVFFVLAGVAAFGALFPHGIGDLIYIYGIRPFLKTPMLPFNPPPRRFACLVGALWSLSIALFLIIGYALIAYILAVMFFLVALPMATIHFCIASVIYQKLFGYHPA